jgi:DNA-binding transcriptional MerR regulator
MDVVLIRQIRSLLYEEGFTIGGARQRLEGEAKQELTPHKQLLDQTIAELEEVLAALTDQ